MMMMTMATPITEPLQVEWVPSQVHGEVGHRLMVVLAAPGCEWARTSGGCTNCSFPPSFGAGRVVSTEEYEAQIHGALRQIPRDHTGPVEVDLFVSGSFFNPNEVSPEAQDLLLRRVAGASMVRRVLVETRPEYVTGDAVTRALAAAGDVALEVGIGLESADLRILRDRIRKGFTWEDFEGSARLLARTGASLLVYLLLKPMATGEREAIEDVVASARKVFVLTHAIGLTARVAVQPCFVGAGTELEDAFRAGEYRPPRLWSVVEAVQRIAPLGQLLVGLSDEGQDTAAVPRGCDRCDGEVRRALGDFNVTQDPGPLTALDCVCRAEWEDAGG